MSPQLGAWRRLMSPRVKSVRSVVSVVVTMAGLRPRFAREMGMIF
jgi:hypothetical protein